MLGKLQFIQPPYHPLIGAKFRVLETTQENFKYAEAALNKSAMDAGYRLCIFRKYPNSTDPSRVTFCCSKGGAYKPSRGREVNEDDPPKKKRKTSTKKTSCPFQIALRRVCTAWVVEGIRGHEAHNHPMVDASAIPEYRTAIVKSREEQIIRFGNEKRPPREILEFLRDEDEAFKKVNAQDISNFLAAYRRQANANRDEDTRDKDPGDEARDGNARDEGARNQDMRDEETQENKEVADPPKEGA